MESFIIDENGEIIDEQDRLALEQLKELEEQESKLSRKLVEKLYDLQEYKDLVDVRDRIKHKKDIRPEYATEVVPIPAKEQRKGMLNALKDIALDNIEDCVNYKGDEQLYLQFINRIHGLKDEWKAFRRTNVDSYNYYIAKAKFMLDSYSYNKAVLMIDAYKDYKFHKKVVEQGKEREKIIETTIKPSNYTESVKEETKAGSQKKEEKSTTGIVNIEKQEPEENKPTNEEEKKEIELTDEEKELKELEDLIEEQKKIYRQLQRKTKHDLKMRGIANRRYERERYRNLSVEEFNFRLECCRILDNAGNIPELREFAPLLNYKYYCGASIIESSKFVLDFDEILKNRALEVQRNEVKKKNKEQGIEELEEKYTYNEFIEMAYEYFNNDKNRGSVNNELRKLERALADYLIEREQGLISGYEFFERFEKANKELDKKDLMIEFAKTMERYKEVTESLKYMATKKPRKTNI